MAALYAKADAFSLASHDVKASVGRQDMTKIENGKDPAQAGADMENAMPWWRRPQNTRQGMRASCVPASFSEINLAAEYLVEASR